MMAVATVQEETVSVQLAMWIRERIGAWGELWGVPGLEARLQVEFTDRFQRSLGRCLPRRGLVRLHAALAAEPRDLLAEVLCHEVAHAAVFDLHSRRCRPHGPEWAALMRAAGYEARTRLSFGAAPPSRRVSVRREALLYEHVCRVCQMRRTGRRPMPAWRCTACLEAGLDGQLEIRSRRVVSRSEPQ
jgi:predicted SprT family Zn-dependent metalloprotease